MKSKLIEKFQKSLKGSAKTHKTSSLKLDFNEQKMFYKRQLTNLKSYIENLRPKEDENILSPQGDLTNPIK